MQKFLNDLLKKPFLLVICFFTVGSTSLSAQVKLKIDPQQTDQYIKSIQGPHLVLYDPNVKPKNKLLLMISGTGGSPKGYLDFENFASEKGYHVVGLDYKNTVITTICTKSDDPQCFDNFRKEIVYGTPVSETVDVDSANSLLNRFTRLLEYLVKNDTQGKWDMFIKNGKIKWENIVVAGHSQGAGHAAYLGQQNKTARVLMFSGPQDYFSTFDRPAGWLSSKPKTSPAKCFAFLHQKDPFNMQWQLASVTKMRQTMSPDTMIVKPGTPVKGSKHVLIADIETNNAHGITLKPEFKNAWEYLLR